MKTIHAARPHYPEYRDPARLTAKRPAIELFLAGLLLGCILCGGWALIELYYSMAVGA
jgi:hypothetical protein